MSLCIQKPKTDVELRRISELWNGRRDVELQLWGYAVQDLEFLRYFSGLERFNVQVPIVRNIDGLRHVEDSLKEFTLASTTVRLSLHPVARCARLESLHLQRQVKDFGALRSLTGLRYLGISGVSLPDLSPLVTFEQLRSLFLGFCKPIDLSLLGRFTDLEALHIIKMNKLRDLSALRLGLNAITASVSAWIPIRRDAPVSFTLTGRPARLRYRRRAHHEQREMVQRAAR